MSEGRKDRYHAGMIEGVRLALKVLELEDDNFCNDAEAVFQKKYVARMARDLADEGLADCCIHEYVASESSARTLGVVRRMQYKLHYMLGGKGEKYPKVPREDHWGFPATKECVKRSVE